MRYKILNTKYLIYFLHTIAVIAEYFFNNVCFTYESIWTICLDENGNSMARFWLTSINYRYLSSFIACISDQFCSVLFLCVLPYLPTYVCTYIPIFYLFSRLLTKLTRLAKTRATTNQYRSNCYGRNILVSYINVEKNRSRSLSQSKISSRSVRLSVCKRKYLFFSLKLKSK